MKKKEDWKVLLTLVLSMGILAGVTLCVMGGSLQKKSPQPVYVEEERVPLSNGEVRLISQTKADRAVVPDKYNCGVQGSLTTVTAGETVNGVKFKESSGKSVMEFGYGNKDISGTVVFENLDFSGNDMGFYNEDKVDRDIKVVFKNCKFAQIKTSESASRMQYVFENCTLQSFYGCNAVFDRCLFGDSYRDAIIPFQNVTVNNCLVRNMATAEGGAGIHSDGTQMFGHKNAEVKNVAFTNCRFEVPAVQTGKNSASVNACIMVQLEYNNGENITFTDCKINGGGYSIYARATRPELSLKNVVFTDVEVGCAKLFKTVYSDVSPAVVFENLKDADALYVGTVWQEAGATHFSVSNDTNQDRTLVIYTEGQNYTFTIPKCPDGKNLYADFEEYPFDLDICIPETSRYAVCFDETGGQYTQLRFVNWGGQEVYLKAEPEEAEEKEELAAGGKQEDTAQESTEQEAARAGILTSGSCGKNVEYSLDEQGTLYLKGTGATYQYHSGKCAPWYEYREKILAVDIGEGITIIGNQCFRDCSRLEKVKLPESLTRIGANAFIRCSSLKEITLPEKIRKIGDFAFAATALEQVSYEGSREDWEQVSLGKRNEELLRCLERSEN